ncbi:DNA repair protein rad52 [Pleosporales sp. CAS-2024a]
MPAPGDQYNGGNVTNPFEERVVNKFTATEIATLQSRLNKQLGPEYISTRPGNGGGKVAYLEGNKAIALANEVFGFNGWSSSLGQVQIDYVDELQNGKVSLGLSIVVRITLKDGTYHEDIGYGSIENGKGKAASFEKAKKEAATDGLKRSLRTFGNVLGNCLYDKEYLKKVQTMKVKPIKFEEGNLHRHADFAPPPKEDQMIVKQETQQTPMRPNQVLRTRTEHLSESFGAEFDDEFDGNLFDGVEMATEGHGDEFSFDSGSTTTGSASASKAIEVVKATNGANGSRSARTSPVRQTGPPRQPPPRVPPTNGINGQGGPQQTRPNQGQGRPPPPGPVQRQPQTPVQQQNYTRPEQNGGRMPAPNGGAKVPPRPSIQQSHQALQNQPPRHTPPDAQSAPARPGPTAQPQGINTASANLAPPNGRPPIGFVTSRAAELLQNTDATAPILNLPIFDPNVESPVPKDKRTPGFDHKRSAPVKREQVGAPPAPLPAGPSRPGSFVNPQQDMSRRIGMPGGGPNYAMSPSANRGAYKPPTFANGAAGVKRERPALQDVSNQGTNGATIAAGEGPDVKRPRVEATGAVTGAENDGPVS